MEWMNDWFGPDGAAPAFRPSFPDRDDPAFTNDTHQTASRAAALIRAIDPDIMGILEAPSRQAELDLFVQQYLSDGDQPRYYTLLGDTGAAQKVGLLFKPTLWVQLVPHFDIADLLDPWQADIDGDALLEAYSFTRAPLVVDVQLGGTMLRLLVAHTKSNYINNGQQLWDDPAQRQNYIVSALKDRRRISTEAMRMRTFLDGLLEADVTTRVIVLGDLNDGPGLDFFEASYLAHNCLDILLGSGFQPEWMLTHAQHDVPATGRYTAIFDDFVSGEPAKHVLLDHILLAPGLKGSHGLHREPGSGTVHHAEYDAQVSSSGQHRQDRPSDHRPVSVRLRF